MMILGIDPGKNTGWALIRLEGRKITPTGQQGVDKNESIITIQKVISEVDLVVIEDFLIRPDKARKGNFDYNNMVAPRVIGKVELLCELTQTQLEKQPASVKPPAYGFANLKYVPGKKGMHWQDAYAHAVYYCVRNLDALPLGA
jgi:hypothetical protein